MFPRSNQMKKIRKDYQRERWEVAQTSYSLGEEADTDIVEYDLDEGWTESVAVPTGKDVPETYTGDRRVGDPRSDVDVRTLPRR